MPASQKPRRDPPSVYQVRLFRNGRNQAVRIPRELELPGTEATLRRAGNQLVLEPRARPSLKTLISRWKPLDVDWPASADPPPKSAKLFK